MPVALEKTLSEKATTRYRQVPREGGLTDWRANEKRCGRKDGHVLTFRKGKIVCVNCTAEWEDYGC
jgi:hypothetical protein